MTTEPKNPNGWIDDFIEYWVASGNRRCIQERLCPGLKDGDPERLQCLAVEREEVVAFGEACESHYLARRRLELALISLLGDAPKEQA